MQVLKCFQKKKFFFGNLLFGGKIRMQEFWKEGGKVLWNESHNKFLLWQLLELVSSLFEVYFLKLPN